MQTSTNRISPEPLTVAPLTPKRLFQQQSFPLPGTLISACLQPAAWAP